MITDSIRGSIVNVSSQASLAGLQDHAVYSATKGAMDAASRVMAVELGERFLLRKRGLRDFYNNTSLLYLWRVA